MVAFDPRMSITDMAQCGLVPWQRIEPFAWTSISITVMHITDTLKHVKAPSGYPARCTALYQDLLSVTNPPFAFYEMSSTSSIPIDNWSTTCDVATRSNATCTNTVWLKYGNQFVLTRKTMREISILDIWVNTGAIVGAVQFFAWFALQAIGG